MNVRACILLSCVLVSGCKASDPKRKPRPRDAGVESDAGEVELKCAKDGEVGCRDQLYYRCELKGDFLVPELQDCAAERLACVPELGCVPCEPESTSCDAEANQQRCRADGSGYDPAQVCDVANGQACEDGACRNLCAEATRFQSYEGCDFFAVDLDNAVIGAGFDASAQQFAVIVSNTSPVPVEVTIEQSDEALGGPDDTKLVAQATIVAGDLEVFALPRREVDGATATGLDDGTHSALSRNAYRIRSTFPVVAYQFNPLNNVDVFSNDASLLLPVASLSERYTVLTWPQTIANDPDPMRDFDPSREDEDQRTFLTIVGTQTATQVKVTLGKDVVQVAGTGTIPTSKAGDVLELSLGAFEVLNLETQGYLADFTGSVVEASAPVAVFVGSEASDVPFFNDRSLRLCCADHLEEQLFPDRSLGTAFAIARMPARTRALNRAFGPTPIVTELNESEWVRILAVDSGTTRVLTTLPAPHDAFELAEGQVVTLEAKQDFVLNSDQRVSVLAAMASQDATGIGKLGADTLPGGDPATVLVAPYQQYRDDYTFLTPEGFAFDFVTIVAPKDASVLLDEVSVTTECETAPLATLADPFFMLRKPVELVVHRCPLSLPEFVSEPRVEQTGGIQRDGVHRIRANAGVGIAVYGFDAFVSYAYPGGLNLRGLD